jgi:lipopolysaccharide transport system permease protein
MSDSNSARAVTVIEPSRGIAFPKLGELWHYRDLLYFLIRRDLGVRYRQTLIGATWAVAGPVAYAIVFSTFLSLIFDRPPSGDVPYPVFLLCGFTLWLFFASAVQQGSTSTLASQSLIPKVYFPRVLLPVSAVTVPALDFLIGFGVLVVTIFLYGLTPSANIVLAPLAFLLAWGMATGVALWFSGIVVRYRDVVFGIPFLLQMLLYSSAVIYPLDLAPETAKQFLALNPMVVVMEMFRWTMLPGVDAPGPLVLIPLAVGVVLIVTGLLNFHRAERGFADVI